jgi:hypothetical protein
MKIEQLWKELEQSATLPAFRRIDESHPLDIYAGIGEDRNPLLLLVTKRVAPETGTFQSLTVRRFRREDTLWSYTIVLDDKKLAPMFALLCTDLVKTTEAMNPELGAAQFFARLGRWKALLASGNVGLNEQEVRGLLAELYVLNELLAPQFGIEACALGWAGPEAEEQDFRIDDRTFEVKAIPTGKTRVRIASLRQLDSLGVSLDLLVIPVTPASQGQGQTLTTLISAIRTDLGGSPQGSLAFESKLMLTGYTESDDASTRPYSFGSPVRYEVTEQFPRLVPTVVPDGLVEAAYTIDLTFCSGFQRAFPL